MSNELAEVVQDEPNLETGSVALMRLIERAATSPDFDVEKLQKLLDVKGQWEANEARKAFVVAKTAFKAEAPTITKNKHVGFTSQRTGGETDYNHATLDNVADTLSPALSKHGLSYSWETEQLDGGVIRVTCVLTHVMGHSERVSLQAGPDQSGNKNNIQAVGSTTTYLQRYTLLAATVMATAEMDDDAKMAGAMPITPEQKDTIIALIKETGVDTKKFCDFMGVGSVDEIMAVRFDFAVKALESKRGKK